MLLSKFSSCPVRDGRGVLCHDEVKCLEIVSTGFIACELDRYLFGNNRERGTCYHQYPVDKISHSIPKADLYVCERNSDGTPGSPIALGDMKLEKLAEASKETAAYCVKAMKVYSGKKATTVNLGLAMTTDRAKMFVNLGGNRIMHQMEICEVSSISSRAVSIEAFFTVLYGAVHYLIEHRIELEAPCILPFEDLEIEQLGRRVFLDNQTRTVYKLYDTNFSEDPFATSESLTQLRSDYLHNVSLTQLNERVHCLQYDYIPGQMKPLDLRQFAPIMKDLNSLHVKNIVHGKENLLFGCTGDEAWIIDFDLSGVEDTLYPPNYNSDQIRERHKDARASRPRKKSHDLYALSIIIEDFFAAKGHATCTHLREHNPDLLAIAQKLLD